MWRGCGVRGSFTNAVVVLVCLAVGCGRIGFDEVVVDRRDAAAVDGSASAACPPMRGDDLALFPFDSDEGTLELLDVAGGHAATQNEALRFVVGPVGCGRALRFEGKTSQFGVIDDHPDWDLDQVTVGLWVRTRMTSGRTGVILSRDAAGTRLPGHFQIAIDQAGRLIAGLQWVDRGPRVYACTEESVPVEEWLRVRVILGAPAMELWVDGVQQRGTDDINPFGGDPGTCGDGTAGSGIAGNDNPWAIGVGTDLSNEASALPTRLPFEGDVDHVWIRPVRDPG